MLEGLWRTMKSNASVKLERSLKAFKKSSEASEVAIVVEVSRLTSEQRREDTAKLLHRQAYFRFEG